MLLWRRNVVVSHYSFASEKVFPLVYLLFGVVFIITVPILMVFNESNADGNLYSSNSETKILIPEVRHSKEAVLILKTATETKIYSPGNPNLADSTETALCSTSILPRFEDRSQLSIKFSCSVSDVIGFELYSYLAVKMNGFSTHDSHFLDQLIFTSANSPQISAEATVSSEIGLKRISSIYDESSALLPADGENVSPALMPSLQTDLWSPDLALRNHTSRTIRFDEIHSNTRWSTGDTQSFTLTVNYEIPMVVAERNAKALTWVKYGFIQFFAFFLALAFLFSGLTDLLFESGVFANYSKIETIKPKKN
ncbi:Oidioi.mRNA.OKI2018_I69.chr2.g5342.t1.cds [Oikopleura dioica]|uniref:Oidioi.mRNA.OKI2018_I69.chr2.g5342.t1.cds n=1 Tax=Oikopleura dioica TaxID=34765 RepID=A0ABN7T983_OIKDI|nr:Oidioi.mRNA.OKI2018_I69.chr2.g5342.t1.cds [Oikopleura dioica]